MTLREEWTKALAGLDRRQKYNARKKVVDGITFDSTKEATHYQELKLRQQAGEIKGLECQVRYSLVVKDRGGKSVEVGAYIADFRYREGVNGLLRVVDVKSAATKTPVYRLKKKIVEAVYGIEITEV